MEEKQRGLRFGSVEFSGYGAFPERFATELISHGVELRRVRFGDGTISGSVSPADYWETARTARRCGLRIRAGKRRGLYFTALRYSRRAGLYVGFLAFVMLTALSGSRIQDIEIVSSGTVTAAQRSQIMSILGECGLTEGSSARRLENSTTAAERRILLEIPEAAWVDVTCVGFRLEAAVEMGTPAPEMLDSDAPCNLVASRAAAVVSHVVRDGVLVADTGSGVPEGGLLVSGTVADAAGNVILKHASAEIIGEYTETREFFVPYKETLRLPEGVYSAQAGCRVHEGARHGLLRVREYLEHVALLDYPAVFHYGGAVAYLLDYVHLVSDQHDGKPQLCVEGLQQLQYRLGGLRV